MREAASRAEEGPGMQGRLVDGGGAPRHRMAWRAGLYNEVCVCVCATRRAPCCTAFKPLRLFQGGRRERMGWCLHNNGASSAASGVFFASGLEEKCLVPLDRR